MAQEVRMPSLGQTTDELRIITWLKSEGDAVGLGEPLLEVETDKAMLTVESFVAGTLLRILRGVGETVQAGEPIAYVGMAGETIAPEGVAGSTEGAPTAPRQVQQETGKVLATPVARQLARTHGIDLTLVRGSGSGGRIEKADVLALVESAGSAPAPPDKADAPAAATVTAVPRHRQVIARRLTRSVQTIPQITLTVTINMGHARARLTALRDTGVGGIGYTHLILSAVAGALRRHSAINRLWVDEGPCYRTLARADVGLAVAGDDTLLVVFIPEPDRLGWPELVRVVDDAVSRGRSGVLAAEDTRQVAISVSNLGMHGVDSFTAIVDPSQTAILAVGRIAEAVTVIDSGIHIVPQLQVSLTIDHRVADGVAAARFLDSIRDGLESDAR